MIFAIWRAQGVRVAWVEWTWVAETDFRSHPDHKHPRPPSSTVLHAYATVPAVEQTTSTHLGMGIRDTRDFVFLENSAQWSADMKHRVPLGAWPWSGPHPNTRFGANTSGNDNKPHRVWKSPRSPCLSTANTFIPCEFAISSCGLTYISAIAVKGCFALDNSCKWLEWRHFIDADIKPHFILFL